MNERSASGSAGAFSNRSAGENDTVPDAFHADWSDEVLSRQPMLFDDLAEEPTQDGSLMDANSWIMLLAALLLALVLFALSV